VVYVVVLEALAPDIIPYVIHHDVEEADSLYFVEVGNTIRRLGGALAVEEQES